MRHQVEELKQNEQAHNSEHELLALGPAGRTVLGVQEEIHAEEAEEHPVVEAVFEDVEGGHRVI